MNAKEMLVNGKKTIQYFKKNGVKHTYYAAKERLEQRKDAAYSYVPPTEETLIKQAKETLEREGRPLISIVVPAYETKEVFLQELLDSVYGQSYYNWELILADASASDAVRDYVEKKYEHREDKRIRYVKLSQNEGISDNTNRGIEFCNGEYICLMDHDDLFTPDALYYMEQAAAKHENPVLLYSDEDKTDTDGAVFYDVNDKYKFNYDLILTNNYICHLMMVRADVMKRLQERKAYDGAQDYDLVLRVIAYLLEQGVSPSRLSEQIIHVPRVLYHWRCHAASTAENTASKMYAYDAGRAALSDFAMKQGWNVDVQHSLHLGFYEICYKQDIMAARGEVGAVVGRVLDRKNCMKACIYDENNRFLYEGLHKEYSGRMHRFSSVQDVAGGSLLCIRLRSEARKFLEEDDVAGIPYIEMAGTGQLDVSAFCDAYKKKYNKEADLEQIGKHLCNKITEAGYLIVYDPKWTVKTNM